MGKGGVLLLTGPDQCAKFDGQAVTGGQEVGANGRVLEETENPAHLRYHRRNRELGRPIGQVRIRYKQRDSVGQWLDYLMVKPDQMREFGEETGFHLEKIYKEDSLYAAILRRG